MQVALPSRMAANNRRVLRRALSNCASIGVIAQILSSVEETIILKLAYMYMYTASEHKLLDQVAVWDAPAGLSIQSQLILNDTKSMPIVPC